MQATARETREWHETADLIAAFLTPKREHEDTDSRCGRAPGGDVHPGPFREEPREELEMHLKMTITEHIRLDWTRWSAAAGGADRVRGADAG